MCGLFGMYAKKTDVARATFFALCALQHRGQESAGITTSDGQLIYTHKGMGLISQVFDEDNLRPLKGDLAIGQTRYSTTGSSHILNAQPYLIDTQHGHLAVGHNGNLTNTLALRSKLLEQGVDLVSSSDSEVITHMLAIANGSDWEGRLTDLMTKAIGAYSLVVLTQNAIFAARDPMGLRPLCLGVSPTGHVIASESCVMGPIMAKYVREVRPGEIIRLDKDGVHSTQGAKPKQLTAFCIFEYIYFARPDSLLEDKMVHQVRQCLGEKLAQEAPVEADLVIGVPKSGIPAAIGYAQGLSIPYGQGLIRNHYIGRTFIQPEERLRRSKVRLKYSPLVSNLIGKRVVMVDDSVVRGNTAGPLVRLLRKAGAIEVHVRISCPPVQHPCFMGVDMPTYQELIAHRMSVPEITSHIDADSLAYLSHEGMSQAVGGKGSCSACFTGKYPVQLEKRNYQKKEFEVT